jgi:hypothetical protein
MRLRWWESAVLAVLLLVAAVFFAAGSWVSGLVLLCVALFGGASRASVVERNVAGFYASTRGLLILTRAAALFVLYGIIIYGFFVMEREHWIRERKGLVAFYACAALAAFLIRDVYRYGNEAIDYLFGGDQEEAVAKQLDPLREQGWVVIHNLVRDDGGGNVDHFVRGPMGAFTVETKSGRHRVADRGQAISNAFWAKKRFGERWVDPILCVGTDPPAAPENIRHGKSDLWVMSKEQLRPWLLARSSRFREQI